MFTNITIRTQLTLLIAFVSTLLAALGGAGLYGIDMSNNGLERVYTQRTVPMGQLGQIRYLILSSRVAIETSLVTSYPDYIKQQGDLVDRNVAEVAELWDQYLKGALTNDEHALAKPVKEQYQQFLTAGLKPALAALRANDLGEAGTVAVEKMRPLSDPVLSGLNALTKLQLYRGKVEYESAVTRYRAAVLIGIAAVGAGILVAVLVGFFLIRALSKALGNAVRWADAVAAGDLTMHVESHSNNEIGRLLRAMKAMNAGLVRIVSEVRSSTVSISGASKQIAAGNADLSARTEQQASSLEETASSMEELTGAVKQNADNAKQANQLAAEASSVAVKGGEVVAQVVSTMSSINDSSKKIADIIGVIDGIAFQTNILALNAAVEAARAGEQGRGFAVVASEVRTLAQRSAAAAKEIKALITDSVNRVGDGTRLVDQAGKTMQEIVDSVKRVTDIMAEIAAASQEQTSGIEQVNQAIVQMDQVTQQNAALVEEAAAAAESMRGQAHSLTEAVAIFKLSAAETPSPRTRGEGEPEREGDSPVRPEGDAVRASKVNGSVGAGAAAPRTRKEGRGKGKRPLDQAA